MKSFDPSKFTTTVPRPLPVMLLLDVSGSMIGDKIDTLNRAVREMLSNFRKEEVRESLIAVSLITFGEVSKLRLPMTPASQVSWQDMVAGGRTPMGSALSIAKNMVEDKSIIPSRAYRPAVVLVSDGMPTDEWQAPLDAFVNHGRSSKCDRMAMAIGSDADRKMLSKFIEGTSHQLFYADNASQINEFFVYLTMSVTIRSRSKNPNEVPNDSDIRTDRAEQTPNRSHPDSSDRTDENTYW